MIRRLRFILAFVLLTSLFAVAIDRQPNADYRARRMKLAEKMKGGTLVLFAPTEQAASSQTDAFHQDENFYYLTGWNEPGAALVIAGATEATETRPARPYTEILFLPDHNLTMEKWTGPKLGAENPQAREVTGFDRVEVLDKMREELVRILPQPRSKVYTDLGRDSASTVPLQWLARANAFPNYNAFSDVKDLMTELRQVKDAGEIERIRKAMEASKAAHRAAFRAMKPGKTEQQIGALMIYEYTSRGCERSAYVPVVGTGFNSTVLHHDAGPKVIEDGDIVVMDVAGEYAGYDSDITRTVPANGHFTPRQREIYEIVLGAQRAAIAAFQAGKSTLTGTGPESLHKVVMDYFNSHGKDLHGAPLGKYFIHGLGHHVGLNVHDPGTGPLQKGAVFTIEPGLYIPEEKIGVRIEDTFYVDENGALVNMSADLPHTPDEVEAAMKQ